MLFQYFFIYYFETCVCLAKITCYRLCCHLQKKDSVREFLFYQNFHQNFPSFFCIYNHDWALIIVDIVLSVANPPPTLSLIIPVVPRAPSLKKAAQDLCKILRVISDQTVCITYNTSIQLETSVALVQSLATNIIIRSSRPDVFCEKGCSQKFHKSHRKTHVPESLF